MYESPITEVLTNLTDRIRIEHENEIVKVVQKAGFTVNKEELEKALLYDRGQYEKGYADAKEEFEMKWIPCSKRLPDDYRYNCYLVCDIKGIMAISFYEPYHGWQVRNLLDVIAWMPLPEPYKE